MLIFSFSLRRLKCSFHFFNYLKVLFLNKTALKILLYYPKSFCFILFESILLHTIRQIPYLLPKKHKGIAILWPAKISSFFSIYKDESCFLRIYTLLMLYKISTSQPHKHLLDITIELDDLVGDILFLNLPVWRPGRYERANFAKNIYSVMAKRATTGEHLKVKKVSTHRWAIPLEGADSVSIHYQYYAYQMDGGGSFVDNTQVYINFINCLLYADGRMDTLCQVQLSLPDHYIIACGLKQEGQILLADTYYRLVDSPLMASPSIQKLTYNVKGHDFYLWINGDWRPNTQKLLPAFKAFTEVQIDTMKGFPCPEYHFMFHILPYRFYHGVEHFNSTVIVLGPSEDMNDNTIMEDLLGVSSHELFHTWNVIRIRPKELLPYAFDRETYFDTGYVAEGFTTYYGDLFLLRSGVFTVADYIANLNKSLQRHFDNFGRFNLSLADASLDLWLDGYTATGAPDRKVSIYIKGSLVALMLDLTIRQYSDSRNSLDDLMRHLWKEYVEEGYTSNDILEIASTLAGISLDSFFDEYIYGTKPIEEALDELLQHIGFRLEAKESIFVSESRFGFRTIQKEGATLIGSIAPSSPAENLLSREDELIAVNGRKISNNLDKLISHDAEIELSLFRNQQLLNVRLQQGTTQHYHQWSIVPVTTPTMVQQDNFKKWAGFYGRS